MTFNVFKNTVLLFVLVMISCASKMKSNKATSEINSTYNHVQKDSSIVVGANQTESYLPLLVKKRVGIVANQTSVIFHNEKQAADKKTFTHL